MAISVQYQPALPSPAANRRYRFGLVASLFFWLLATCTIWQPAWAMRVLSWFGFGGDYDGVLSLAVVSIYYGNSFLSPVLRYLWRMNSHEDFVSYMDRLRATPPEVGFQCQCSHTLARVMETSAAGSDGSSTPSVAIQNETVVTYSGREEFTYSRWEDVPPQDAAAPSGYNVIAVDLSCQIYAGDAATQARYEEARTRFHDANRGLDVDFQSSEYSLAPGFYPRMLLFVDRSRKPLAMHWLVYVVAALVGLSWPYRIWFESRTGHFQTEVRKRFFA